ncbi:hypothetical protein KUTeg_005966 [Tegillarca granosa]|uniref:PiggyBac transposable element-derived protein domain-containing protein n=1 Tax=Tegillarca granosa TaxID=220873 RepID=A0ABQ9FF32_TEGGR|nr:hypothetical protein KUTeg_005966 [Tegillarca granosa]
MLNNTWPTHKDGNSSAAKIKNVLNTMPIRRFSELMRYFHINDNSTQGHSETPNYDRCDPDGYCHDFRPYLGKHDIFRGRGLGERVATHMCCDLKCRSYHVFFDRYLTSIRLLRILKENGMYAYGTISKTSEGFPKGTKESCWLGWGDYLQLQHDSLDATVWND